MNDREKAQRPSEEQKQFFTTHGLVLPKNALIARNIIEFITEEPEKTAERLRLMWFLHTAVIGLELDDGCSITYIRMRSIRERTSESGHHRYCLFQAHLKTPYGGNTSRPLTSCYKNGTPLFGSPHPWLLSGVTYRKLKDSSVKKICAYLLQKSESSLEWEFLTPEKLIPGAHFGLRFLGDKTATDKDLELLAQVLEGLELPRGVCIRRIFQRGKDRVYYRVSVDMESVQESDHTTVSHS
ncbi:MAG: hypothetical protein A2W52_01790 [Candidatus Taylorbacteria bacterium RIFCSPHIGHO2_02_49_25]|uniref:Uncharacterized protein n=1 Tax=Candidatus Taylorbacteria bacterium RIFCSPHIGHO2_02_49_25 TaxID=1802305 RepID=A0A1G2MHT0_9BACT|nr:MAG: hypothetical protein UY62_C0045G0009 [Parcubacteria group bacterium GW2011_GWF2_50_9]OHA20035.1 MAG: hypothetical protein A2759_02625 [Candidatus Taylorbacteria bacterium RIFCSPHIGHO2_01_FULL_49_60]OHA23428.1 MAG: hypothetical protein A2W52_01790 [Candidatus Taylorbacteria bacterium RIFCSPHIGHO2_02_49_25]OHA35380.1 MAG: hypothetical protein A3B27_00685 [Candidatus Taylorbacteria bacterium RIFCSPLOWO2_01_FULL_50_130]OHA36787.1 MAG: hypothetical protein A2W65_04005 [Candidatus Taylorbacte